MKKILNPPADPPSSKTKEEDETKDNLGRIFSEFSTILSIEDIVGGISKVSLTLQVPLSFSPLILSMTKYKDNRREREGEERINLANLVRLGNIGEIRSILDLQSARLWTTHGRSTS